MYGYVPYINILMHVDIRLDYDIYEYSRTRAMSPTFGPGRQITFFRLAKEPYVHAFPNSKICPYDHVRVRSQNFRKIVR